MTLAPARRVTSPAHPRQTNLSIFSAKFLNVRRGSIYPSFHVRSALSVCLMSLGPTLAATTISFENVSPPLRSFNRVAVCLPSLSCVCLSVSLSVSLSLPAQIHLIAQTVKYRKRRRRGGEGRAEYPPKESSPIEIVAMVAALLRVLL